MANPPSILASVAGVATAGTQLSLGLYKISNRLLNAPAEIAALAQELSLISATTLHLEELVKNSRNLVKAELLTTTQAILSRFTKLQKDLRDIIKDIARSKKSKRLKWAFQHSKIQDVLLKINSLKQLLMLAVSTLQVAIDQHRIQKSRKRKSSQETSSVNRYREIAEGFVEACREAIKLLRDEQQRRDLGSNKEANDYRHWNESPDKTAAWIYCTVFARAMHTTPSSLRQNAQGYAKTVRTTDGDDQPSESEDGVRHHNTTKGDREVFLEVPNHIPPNLIRELHVTQDLKTKVVNELLHSWTKLDERQIVQSAESWAESKESHKLRKNVDAVIKLCLAEAPAGEDPFVEEEWDLGQSRKARRQKKKANRSKIDISGVLSSNTKVPRRRQEIGTTKAITESDSDSESELESPSGDEEINLPSRNGQSPETIDRTRRLARNTTESQDIYLGIQTTPLLSSSPSSFPVLHAPTPPQPQNTSGRVPGPHSSPLLRASQVQNLGGAEKVPEKPQIELGSDDLHKQPTRENDQLQHPALNNPTVNGIDGSKLNGENYHGDANRHTTTTPSGDWRNIPAILVRNQQDSSPRLQIPGHNSKPIQNTDTTSNRYLPEQATQNNRVETIIDSNENSLSSVEPPAYQPATSRRPPTARFNLQPQSQPLPQPLPRQQVPNTESEYDFMVDSGTDHLKKPHFNPRSASHTRSSQSPFAPFNSDEQQILDPNHFRAPYGPMPPLPQYPHLLPPPSGWLPPNVPYSSFDAGSRESEETISKLKMSLSTVSKRMEEYESQLRRAEAEKLEIKRQEELKRREAAEAETRRVERERELQIQELSRKVIELQKEDSLKLAQRENEMRRSALEAESIRQVTAEAIAEARREGELRAEDTVKKLQEEFEKKLALEREQLLALKEQIEQANTSSRTLRRGETASGGTRPNPFDYLERNPLEYQVRGSETSYMTESSSATPTESGLRTISERQVNEPASQEESVSGSQAQQSNFILFPARRGWGDPRNTQLGSYLLSSGFKPMYEDTQPPHSGPSHGFQCVGSAGNVLRGTLFWEPPGPTAEGELYKSLRNCGWRPTYVRATSSGQTWFFGPQPVHVQFFQHQYKPQIGPLDPLRASFGHEEESLIISKDVVELEELDLLGHAFTEQNGYVFLDSRLTSEDVDYIVARSFLLREGRYRRKYRNLDQQLSPFRADAFEVASDSGTTRKSSSVTTEKTSRFRSWLSRAGSND